MADLLGKIKNNCIEFGLKTPMNSLLSDIEFTIRYKPGQAEVDRKNGIFIQCKKNCNIKKRPQRLGPCRKTNNFKEDRDYHYRSVLHILICGGEAEQAKELIQRGADPWRTTRDEAPLMLFAIKSSCVNVVRLILDCGWNISQPLHPKYLTTTMHLAVELNEPKLVQLLLHYGANVNEIHPKKRTPLHVACEVGNVEMVRLLLNHGASVNNESFNPHTPLNLAIISRKAKIVRLLFEYGANIHPCSILFASIHYAKMVFHQILRRQADINRELLVSAGTVLHLAVKVDAGKLIILGNWTNLTLNPFTLKNKYATLELLNRDVNVNTLADANQIALHIAVDLNSIVLIKNLLDYESDVRARNASGLTALQSAIVREYMNQKIVRLFILYYTDYCLNQDEILLIGDSFKASIVHHIILERQVMKLFLTRDFCSPEEKEKIFQRYCNLAMEKEALIEFKSKCLQELEIMRSIQVSHCLTAFKILRFNKRQAVSLMSTKNYRTILNMVPKILNLCPIYGLIFSRKCVTGKRYAPIYLKAVELACKQLVHFGLPPRIWEIIIGFYNYRTMKQFIKCMEITSR